MYYLLMIIASMLFGIYPSLQTMILDAGASPIALVMICNGIACTIGLTASLVTGQSLRVTRAQLLSLIAIGALGLFTTDLVLNIAYRMLPVGYVTMIHFLYPTIVIIALALLFRQKMTRRKLLAIILSIAGLILLAGGGGNISLAGVLTALVTAFSYAFYMIASEKSPAGVLPAPVRLFYTNMIVTVCALIGGFGFTRSSLVFPQTPPMAALSILVGCLLGFAILLLNAAVTRLGSGTASFVNMIEPVTSLTVSTIVFRYPVRAGAFIGCLLILSSLLFIAKE